MGLRRRFAGSVLAAATVAGLAAGCSSSSPGSSPDGGNGSPLTIGADLAEFAFPAGAAWRDAEA